MRAVPQTPRVTVYIALGSNLGERDVYLRRAVAALRTTDGFTVRRVSRFYETDPIGKTDQPPFLNGVLEGETALPPGALLTTLQGIEKTLGRVHRERWGPREIDLDLLLYGNRVIEEKELTIPHPHLHERDFVLVPLSDLCPALRHPKLNKTVREFLEESGSIHASHPKPYPIEGSGEAL